jgi:hypothetical protein
LKRQLLGKWVLSRNFEPSLFGQASIGAADGQPSTWKQTFVFVSTTTAVLLGELYMETDEFAEFM